MSHVRLACIARNEAEALPELAANVRGLIDSWVIVVDQRTTDDTERIAYEVFKGIPGRVVTSRLDDETFDFAAARNELMDAAKPRDKSERLSTHLLLLDIDSPCVGEIPDELTAPVYVVDVRDEHGWTWKMPVLVRCDAVGQWKMPAHEYLELLCEPSGIEYLPDLYVKRHGAGTNETRKRWTVDVLKREMEAGREDAGRACFFLANTYHSLGDNDEALEHYILRVGMNGIPEETFFAMYRVGCLLQQTNVMKAARAFLDAYALRPSRSEPLFHLAEIANALGNYQMALAFANQGLSNPPSTDSQFVERWIEEWGMRLQWTVAAFHIGIPEASEILDQLLEMLGTLDLYPEYRAVLKSLRPDPVAELPKWFQVTGESFFKEQLVQFRDTPGLRYLQIGCFAGDASAWLLENVLTGEDCQLHDVDTWEGSADIHNIDFAAVEARYDEQVAPYSGVVRKFKTMSGPYLVSLPAEPIYDFIYIDGDHTAFGTLTDAIGSARRLKVGGILAFDDYTWRTNESPMHHPYPAIDAFGALFADQFDVLATGAQVWLKKTA